MEKVLRVLLAWEYLGAKPRCASALHQTTLYHDDALQHVLSQMRRLCSGEPVRHAMRELVVLRLPCCFTVLQVEGDHN